MYKTTIVIWSEYNPEESELELVDLAAEATNGDMYCSVMETEYIPNRDLEEDPDWDGTEFFSENIAED